MVSNALYSYNIHIIALKRNLTHTCSNKVIDHRFGKILKQACSKKVSDHRFGKILCYLET